METKYFASASVPKAMVKFIVPTILSQLVTLLYNLAYQMLFLLDTRTILIRWQL